MMNFLPTVGAAKAISTWKSAKKDKSFEEALERLIAGLPQKDRRAVLEESAQDIARVVSANLVREALLESRKTLRQIQEDAGLEPSMISRIATGHHKNGPHVWSLVAIARALGRNLKITIE